MGDRNLKVWLLIILCMSLKMFAAHSTIRVDPFGLARWVSVYLCCPSNTMQVIFLLVEISLLLLMESLEKELSHSFLFFFGVKTWCYTVINTPAGFTSSAAMLTVVWKAGSNRWNVGQTGKTFVLMLGEWKQKWSLWELTRQSQKPASPPAPHALWSVGFWDANNCPAESHVSSDSIPIRSHQTCHYRRERNPSTHQGAKVLLPCGCSWGAKTNALHTPPSLAGSSWLGGSKVRQAFLTHLATVTRWLCGGQELAH